MLLACCARAGADTDRAAVTGHYINSPGSRDAASAGTITPQPIESRPLLRPGTLLELIPGMAVTQHSGAGKANQTFLRRFNLDHGTDFAPWVAGMPVNLRTHAHGYTDLCFITAELISRVDYRKDPYCAQIGDFPSAGGAKMAYSDGLLVRVPAQPVLELLLRPERRGWMTWSRAAPAPSRPTTRSGPTRACSPRTRRKATPCPARRTGW